MSAPHTQPRTSRCPSDTPRRLSLVHSAGRNAFRQTPHRATARVLPESKHAAQPSPWHTAQLTSSGCGSQTTWTFSSDRKRTTPRFVTIRTEPSYRLDQKTYARTLPTLSTGAYTSSPMFTF